MMRHAWLVVPELFLPRKAAGGGLRAPALEKLLARAQSAPLPEVSLETWLCAAFGVEGGAVAPVTLQADGVQPGSAYWLRADPVHLVLRGSELILHPLASLTEDEASLFCDSLNRHFAGDGLHFVAPEPQRWYLRLQDAPGITNHPLAQVAGKDMRAYLPHGPDALHWHKLLNEMQMLLYQHPANQIREARGEWMVNSVWLWGGGRAQSLGRPFGGVRTDSELAVAFAQAAGIAALPLPSTDLQWMSHSTGTCLIVWDGLRHALHQGNLGEWRDSLNNLERSCLNPLLGALRRGNIERITLDALQEQGSLRFVLTRGMAWRFWRGSKRLECYAGDAVSQP